MEENKMKFDIKKLRRKAENIFDVYLSGCYPFEISYEDFEKYLEILCYSALSHSLKRLDFSDSIEMVRFIFYTQTDVHDFAKDFILFKYGKFETRE